MPESTTRTTNVTPFPMVRDLTEGGRRLPIETDGSAVYDLLLTIWSTFGSDEEHTAFEVGTEWFEQIAARTSPELRQEIETVGGLQGSSWLALIGQVATAPYPHDIDSVLGWVGGLDSAEFRRNLLSNKCEIDEADAHLLDRAITGDFEALEMLLGDRTDLADHFRRLFDLEEGELRDRIVAVLTRFRMEVYGEFETDFGQATSRAASARRALARGADPERVIEDVTNGLDYRIQPGVGRMMLIPSLVLRPWAIIDQHDDMLIVVYPVADEFIDADPDAPPSWVVKLHKALADERRLRILRRLSDGPAGLDVLAEMLGLTKSTVHHHVGLLRAAGLVRVAMDKTYTLRRSVLPEAQRTLDDYLRTDNRVSETRRSDT